jgi:hypothetical protein
VGTFHHDSHPLHGITVVVETKGPEVHIGRCDTMDDQTIVLLDVDTHVGDDPAPRAAYLAKAASVGVWGKTRKLIVPMSGVTSVRPLFEYSS